MRIAVTGGSGLLGRVLVSQLSARDHDTVVITRGGARMAAFGMVPRVSVEAGDPSKPGPWQAAVSKADVVVHLASPSMFDTTITLAAQRQQRVRIMRELARCIAEAPTPPKALLIASSTTVYGERLDPVDEHSPVGAGPYADMFAETEREAVAAQSKTRVVALRFGQLLGPGCRLAAVTSAAALPAPSRMPFSFIHIADAVSLIVKAISSSFAGPLNVVATPTTIVALHKALNVTAPPAPSFGARLFGKTAPPVALELVLAGQAAKSSFAQALDFYATHATIDAAIKASRR